MATIRSHSEAIFLPPCLSCSPPSSPSLTLLTNKRTSRDCVTYLMGDQCYEYIHTDWKVFSENDTHLTEARIASVVEISHRFSKKCRLFIKSVLCHMVLPYCDPFTVDTGPYNPLPMCPVTCTDVEEQCGQEIDRFGESFSKFLKKRCAADIAKSANVGPGDKPGCIYVNPDHPLKGSSIHLPCIYIHLYLYI